MYSTELKTQQPFASKFFEAALNENSKKFAQAYMLTGSDILAQYNLAIQTAKILNCHTKSQNCNCVNCQWIKDNKHPAVITISPIDYTFANKDYKTGQVISINQAHYLKNELAKSSNYHRVIIFTNAVEGNSYINEFDTVWAQYKNVLMPPPVTYKDEPTERDSWLPRPLNRKILNTESANALLKTIEEPTGEVTFFFLTRDKEDMLETIASRCQVIPVASHQTANVFMEQEAINDIFNKLPLNNYTSAVSLSEYILALAKKYPLAEIFDVMQIYYKKLLESDTRYSKIIINNLITLEQAKLQLLSNVNELSVVETVCFKLVIKL